MADKHVRAKCLTTGAIASLPQKALQLGHIKNWVEADGPTPKRPKSAAFSRRKADEAEIADSESANTEEE